MRKTTVERRLVVYPIIYRVLHIPGGCWGFLPSTLVFQFDQENIQNSETERPIG